VLDPVTYVLEIVSSFPESRTCREIEHCKLSSQITENILDVDQFHTPRRHSNDWCLQRFAFPFTYYPVHGHINKPGAAEPIAHLGAHLANALKETLFSLIAKEPGELRDGRDRQSRLRKMCYQR